ncbi:hypothetical protein [Neptunomonas antarctica]|uniref:Delta-1-pyrroline-5-carboxylate dehydrogenase n=1 Tax=Neptunomonas antarctica TaxID=619304 RepID=A0A1N7J372_9GAMM|nr:hypothetical protein [Neptunomonas antarctica]SIS43815.1 delta-1-pyrroline-5-carboxylate dehydrogenase [Neptunomonas antarctica]
MTIQTLDNAVMKAESAWEAWNALGAAARIVQLKKAAQELNQPLVNWLLNNVAASMPDSVILPGPTGEANSLNWSGRGVICICADSAASDTAAFDTAIAAQLFTALATGNVVIMQTVDKYAHQLHAALLNTGIGDSIAQLTSASIDELSRHEGFHAYAFCGMPAPLITLNKTLSQRNGVLAQLISETEFETYPTLTSLDYPWRFVTESTLSVNTTAVGGNATLLELGGKDH